VIFSLCSEVSFADQERSPESYKIVTANGKYVFIMHPDKSGLRDGRDKALLKEYPQTGLYTNDQRKTLLWSVDWYASRVYVSSDGKHLIRVGPWPQGSPLLPPKKFDAAEILIKVHNKEPIGPTADKEALSQLAIAFYDRGTLIKSYSIGDLIRKPAELPVSVSHFEWCKKGSYNDKNGQINLTTYDGQNFMFDLSGNILQSKN
jgi:hypothetical protein